MSAHRVVPVLLAGLLLSVPACGSPPRESSGPADAGGLAAARSHGATGTIATGTDGRNPPTITSFDVPTPVPCTPGTPARILVTYGTTGAMTVTFVVDTKQAEGQPPTSGTFAVPVPCDGTAHTVVIFAVAPDMSTSTRSKVTVAG